MTGRVGEMEGSVAWHQPCYTASEDVRDPSSGCMMAGHVFGGRVTHDDVLERSISLTEGPPGGCRSAKEFGVSSRPPSVSSGNRSLVLLLTR